MTIAPVPTNTKANVPKTSADNFRIVSVMSSNPSSHGRWFPSGTDLDPEGTEHTGPQADSGCCFLLGERQGFQGRTTVEAGSILPVASSPASQRGLKRRVRRHEPRRAEGEAGCHLPAP